MELRPVRKVSVDLVQVGGPGLHRRLDGVDDELLIVADFHPTPEWEEVKEARAIKVTLFSYSSQDKHSFKCHDGKRQLNLTRKGVKEKGA